MNASVTKPKPAKLGAEKLTPEKSAAGSLKRRAGRGKRG